jgi:hypothetical protein
VPPLPLLAVPELPGAPAAVIWLEEEDVGMIFLIRPTNGTPLAKNNVQNASKKPQMHFEKRSHAMARRGVAVPSKHIYNKS